jgi:hypothetical protein
VEIDAFERRAARVAAERAAFGGDAPDIRAETDGRQFSSGE